MQSSPCPQPPGLCKPSQTSPPPPPPLPLNQVLWPAHVLCMGAIFRTSSWRDTPRETSAISDSWTGREETDLLQGPDRHVLDQEARLGDRDPLPVPSLAVVNSASPVLTLAMTSAPMSLPNPPWKLPWPPISRTLFLGEKKGVSPSDLCPQGVIPGTVASIPTPHL